ncbi:MAG: glycosyltransferase family 2 protein [Planctomycetota bacterium]|jgi:glycosyltransferase involved in cell wall biosynthesis|nr:glycosyltransferase family 2 protein [Planctomycetota bacterium]
MDLGEPIQLTEAAPGSTQAWPTGMAVLIPVYNHKATVAKVAGEAMALGAPVLVVDDGSTDGSGDAARQAGADVLSLPHNQGKAAALRAGMHELTRRGYRQALTADADGQHPTHEIERLAHEASDSAAIYIGARDMRCAPFSSRLGRFLSNTSSWIVSGAWMGDSQSGLRVYPLPSTTLLNAPAKRYAYEIEILVRAAWAKIPVRTLAVSVIYPKDRISHFGKMRDNISAGLVLTKLFAHRICPWTRAARVDQLIAAQAPSDA